MIMGCIVEEDNLAPFGFDEDEDETTPNNKYTNANLNDEIILDEDFLDGSATPQTRSDTFEAGTNSTYGCNQ